MKKLAVTLLIVALAIAAWYFAGVSLSWDSFVEHERALRHAVARHPAVAVIVGVLLYTLTSLIPGTTGKSIAFGWLFGFWIGLAIVSVSLTAAAVIAMMAVRSYFRDWALRRVPRIVGTIDQSLERGGEATCLLTLRLLHVPYTGVNYSAGATSVPLPTFVWTTLLGMLPSNLVFVLAGARLPALDRMAEVRPWQLIDWPLLSAATLAIATPMVAKKLTRISKSASKSADGSSDEKRREVTAS
ncbi:TVP38/TMEM64 family protein [Stieleria sp.]|uniref:TVP38/TMEM64 family protein n=1 Tax=Stieleria sp. TaxID=2795976 RepID=UPI003562997D